MSLTTRARRLHEHPVIGSQYVGIPWDRPCLRKMPAGWYLHEPKRESVAMPLLGIAIGILFALLVIRQIFP